MTDEERHEEGVERFEQLVGNTEFAIFVDQEAMIPCNRIIMATVGQIMEDSREEVDKILDSGYMTNYRDLHDLLVRIVLQNLCAYYKEELA